MLRSPKSPPFLQAPFRVGAVAHVPHVCRPHVAHAPLTSCHAPTAALPPSLGELGRVSSAPGESGGLKIPSTPDTFTQGRPASRTSSRPTRTGILPRGRCSRVPMWFRPDPSERFGTSSIGFAAHIGAGQAEFDCTCTGSLLKSWSDYLSSVKNTHRSRTSETSSESEPCAPIVEPPAD